jgi:hypothetical protein
MTTRYMHRLADKKERRTESEVDGGAASIHFIGIEYCSLESLGLKRGPTERGGSTALDGVQLGRVWRKEPQVSPIRYCNRGRGISKGKNLWLPRSVEGIGGVTRWDAGTRISRGKTDRVSQYMKSANIKTCYL